MKNATRYRLLAACALLSLLLVLPAPLPAQKLARQAGQVTLDFQEVELTDLIQTVSELTGKNFLYDESVKGKVTIVSPDSMTLDEAYQLFLSVLSVKGYTIIPSGKVNKIVPVKGARSANLPTVVGDRVQGTEQFVTRLVRLKHLDAETIASNVLAPLVPPTGNLIAYPPTNTLIITDSGANIDRLMRIIRELDLPGSGSLLEIIPLQNANAEVVAKICAELISQPRAARARRVRTETATPQEEVSKVIAYKRTNSLIVMTNPDDLALIKGLVARMDQETNSKRSNINLYYLENADAETLAGTMNEMLTGIKSEGRAAGKDRQDKSPLSSGPVTITADKPTNSLIINASPEAYGTLEGIIRQLDIRRKQVYVEALILELSMDATKRLGVSLQGAGTVSDDGLITGSSNMNTGPLGLGDIVGDPEGGDVSPLLSRALDGLLAGGFFNPITVTGPNGEEITVPTLSVLIDIAQTDRDVNILSAPRLLTSDNEEAEIIVGSNVPIITSRLTDSGSTGLAQSVSVDRQDVALILRFTPQVTEGNLVRLKVYQELTNVVPATAALTSSVGDPNEVGPTFTKRVIRNTVLAEDGKTVVLGGLIGTNVTETVSKTPLLGDLPLIGWLFRRTQTLEEKTNLLVFINPRIIKDSGDLDDITNRNRKAASGFLTEEVIDALPANFFGDLGGKPQSVTPDSPAIVAPEEKTERYVPGLNSDKPSQWVTPPPRRATDL